MLNRIQGKQVYRMLLVSVLLVFSLSTVVLADDSPSASDPTSDLYPLWYSLQDIYEAFKSTYNLLDGWAETFLPNIESAVKDIKSYLYYNGQSAAYYLYMIESHLSDIASGTGSSGSSSPTDLTEVLEWLETATGLIGQTQVHVNALLVGQGTTHDQLSELSTNMDSVVSKLSTANSYFYSIVLDLSDALDYLETSTGLIGQTQTAVSALNEQVGTANGILATIRDRLTYNGVSLANYAYLINSNLVNKLATVTGNQEAILALLQEEGAFTTDLSGVLADLSTVISNQEAILALLQEEGAFTTDLSGVLADLGTIISNQSSVLSVLQQISDRLYYPDAGIDYYVFQINKNLVNKLATVTGNQEAILALLQADGAFTTDLSGVLEKLSNIENALSSQDVKAADYLYLIDDTLNYTHTIIKNMDTRQQSISEKLTYLSNSLSYNGLPLANYVYQINDNLVNKLATVTGNQEAILALLQEEGAFTTDLSGVLADLDTVISNQGAALPVLQEVSTTLSNIDNSLSAQGISAVTYLALIDDTVNNIHTTIKNMSTTQQSIYEKLISYSAFFSYNGLPLANYAYQINDNLVNKLATVTGNQEAILALLQQEGSSTTDLTGVLSELGEMGTDVSSINDFLSGWSASIKGVANSASSISSKLNLVIDNQRNIFALLQEEGVFTTDLSGVLADLGAMLENQNTALPVLQSVSDSLSTISSRLYYVDASVSYYVYSINRQLREKLPVLISNQEAGLENQQKLIELIEDLEFTTNVTVENIENITIDVTNKAYEVFYITDSDGNKQNISDFSGDVLSVGGRLLNFFFKVAFDDALDSVDSAIDDMTEFYLDDSVVLEGSSLWE